MTVQQSISAGIEPFTGNVEPLLHEIRHALRRLADGEDGTAIDLYRLPLAPGEEQRIEALLGTGEVRAELDSLGPTLVQETAIPGVWFVTHRNTDDTVVARLIEVTRMPELLKSQQADIEQGLRKLESALSEFDREPRGDADERRA